MDSLPGATRSRIVWKRFFGVIATRMFEPKLDLNHDATIETGELVQMTFMQNDGTVALRQEPRHLAVLRLAPNCSIEII